MSTSVPRADSPPEMKASSPIGDTTEGGRAGCRGSGGRLAAGALLSMTPFSSFSHGRNQGKGGSNGEKPHAVSLVSVAGWMLLLCGPRDGQVLIMLREHGWFLHYLSFSSLPLRTHTMKAVKPPFLSVSKHVLSISQVPSRCYVLGTQM